MKKIETQALWAEKISAPITDMGAVEELEFVGKIEEEWGSVDGELEIGEETLDFASPLGLLLLLLISLEAESAPPISCFDGPCGCLIIPYKTSAISISISSWADDDDLLVVDFGGLCFGPLGF